MRGGRAAASGAVARPWSVEGRRPTVVLVDRAAIAHNVRLLSPAGVEVLAMVKGDGYGHGAAEVAATALAAGATWLGVALVEEGLRLRRSVDAAPILVTTECPAGAERAALAAGLTPTVYTEGGVRRLGEAAAGLGCRPRVHLKVETGLNRVGVAAPDAARFGALLAGAGLELDGVWTHLATSEDPDDPFTGVQVARLRSAVAALAEAGHRPRLVHAANTGAVLAWPAARFDLVRLGIGMYGVSPNPALPGASALRPALSWHSRVAFTKRVRRGEGISYGLTYRPARDTTIATVPVGFADGYPRLLSNRGELLIGGRRRPVVGVIAMDQLMVDCGDGPVRPGDEVVLLGRQGGASIGVDELAGWAGTIPDEIFCGIAHRVPRRYVN